MESFTDRDYNPYSPEAVEYWHVEVTKHIGWVIKYASEYFLDRGYSSIKMIDVGCCTGRLVQKMDELIPVTEAILVDAVGEFVDYAQNLFGNKYKYEACVLSNMDGESILTLPQPHASGINLGGATAQKIGINYREGVRMRSFDSLWREKYTGFEPDFIKIDAEGFDLNILEGMKDFLSSLRRKPLITYEFAGLNLSDDDKQLVQDRLKFLVEMGYRPVIEDTLTPSKCCDMMIAV